MRAHQGEARNAVVKRRGIPTLGGMAIRTVPRGKAGARRRMHGSIGLLPGGEMAARCAASRGRNLQVVVIVDMAGSAGHVGVAIGQEETGGAMVKDSVVPTCGVVALRAVCGGKGGAGLRMHWIVGLLPGGEMALRVAAIGGGNLQVVVIVDVARGAGYVGVAVGQQKPGGAVIKRGAQPTVKFMATLAIAGGKGRAGAGVNRICSVLPIFQVAGITGGAQPEKHPRRGLLVALIALHGGVSAQQWKPVLMIADLLHRDIPALHGVALRTVRAHLTSVNVCVAIGAVLANVGEYGFYVALRTVHFFVHSAQRIFCLVVIEFGDRADRAPAG